MFSGKLYTLKGLRYYCSRLHETPGPVHATLETDKLAEDRVEFSIRATILALQDWQKVENCRIATLSSEL